MPRSKNHFQIVACAQRYNLFLADTLLDAFEVGFNGLLQLVGPRMFVGNLAQHFGNDQILALVNAKVRMIGVIRIHLCVHGQRQIEHFGAHRSQSLFGIREHLFGSDLRLHHQPEFLIVGFLA
jgi:hypothetical protein